MSDNQCLIDNLRGLRNEPPGEYVKDAAFEIESLNTRVAELEARWACIKTDTDGARSLLLLLKHGKGSSDDFDTMVDRIIESRRGAGLSP